MSVKWSGYRKGIFWGVIPFSIALIFVFYFAKKRRKIKKSKNQKQINQYYSPDFSKLANIIENGKIRRDLFPSMPMNHENTIQIKKYTPIKKGWSVRYLGDDCQEALNEAEKISEKDIDI